VAIICPKYVMSQYRFSMLHEQTTCNLLTHSVAAIVCAKFKVKETKVDSGVVQVR